MNPYLTRGRDFWNQRSPRERTALAIAIAVVVLGLGYGLLLEPLHKANKKLAASLPQQRAELRLLRVQASEIERLRGQNRSVAKSGSVLVHAIETAAAVHGVREAIAKLAPLTKDRVQVATGPIAVTAWLAWFADLEREGVAIASCRVTMTPKPGVVGIEAILTGGTK